MEFPPKQSWSILVSFEFLYVINWDCFFSIVANAEITLPNSRSPKLILIPSFKVDPVAPVFFALYEPAKSTKKNLAVIKPSSTADFSFFFSSFLYKSSITCCYIKIVNIACDLDEASFIIVDAVVRWYPPLSSRSSICSEVVTYS